MRTLIAYTILLSILLSCNYVDDRLENFVTNYTLELNKNKGHDIDSIFVAEYVIENSYLNTVGPSDIWKVDFRILYKRGGLDGREIHYLGVSRDNKSNEWVLDTIYKISKPRE